MLEIMMVSRFNSLFQGEVCAAGSCVYVQEGIYEDFEKKLVAKAKAWSVGDPFDLSVRQGPQVRTNAGKKQEPARFCDKAYG